MANTLRRKLLFVAAEELEALALSDLRMEAIGFSPLTGENLMLDETEFDFCLLYTSPSPRDNRTSRMPSSA